jgi:hypothetical protein
LGYSKFSIEEEEGELLHIPWSFCRVGFIYSCLYINDLQRHLLLLVASEDAFVEVAGYGAASTNACHLYKCIFRSGLFCKPL